MGEGSQTMVTKIKRWKMMNRVFMISIGLIILFAWFDSEHLIGIKEIDRQWTGKYFSRYLSRYLSPN